MLHRSSLCSTVPEKTGLLHDYDDLPPDIPPPPIPNEWDLSELLPEEQEFVNTMPAWKKYARLVLPHIGLCLLSLLYISAGAFIFLHVERPNELEVRSSSIRQIESEKQKMLKHIWQLLNEATVSREQIEKDALGHIDDITRLLFEAFDTHYVTAKHLNQELDSSEDEFSWTFTTAAFYCATLLMTIGYGNLVCTTQLGRLFCIFYALLGVPLILITVADIGKFLSENIVRLYTAYSRTKKKFNKRYNEVVNNNNNLTASLNDICTEDLDEEAAKEKDQLVQVGLENYVAIPISLIIFILLGYMTIGAFLLAEWENWNVYEGFYFSFITMTTVGFGDYYPINEKYFFLDLAYIIIGLAITTMCIDLVGIQYIRKIHYFGRAIKDARFALVNVGGKMVHVPDLMKYAVVLQHKYGQKKQNGDEIKGAFAPKDLPLIRYIDYGAMASLDSISSLWSLVFGKSRQPSMV